MTDAAQMAQEFLKLWQKQMSSAMTDPKAVAATLDAMKGFYTAPEAPNDARARRPAAAPDAAQHAVRDLTRRLDKLEQSVGKLHARLDAAEKPARAKPRPVAKRVERNKRAAKPNGKRMAAKSKSKPKPKAKRKKK